MQKVQKTYTTEFMHIDYLMRTHMCSIWPHQFVNVHKRYS